MLSQVLCYNVKNFPHRRLLFRETAALAIKQDFSMQESEVAESSNYTGLILIYRHCLFPQLVREERRKFSSTVYF